MCRIDALILAGLGFCLGVGQPPSMTTVVHTAPDGARSTALALRLTGNRLGQAGAPAGAGLVAGVVGVAAPFVMLGVLLVVSSGIVLRLPAGPGQGPGRDGKAKKDAGEGRGRGGRRRRAGGRHEGRRGGRWPAVRGFPGPDGGQATGR